MSATVKQLKPDLMELPHSPESERYCIAAMLNSREAFFKARDIFGDFAFFTPAYQLVYSALVELTAKKTPVDLFSVSSALNNHLEFIGGTGFVADLWNSVATTAHIEYHAANVKKHAVYRHLIQQCEQTIQECYRADLEPDAIASTLQRQISKSLSGSVQSTRHISEYIEPVLKQLSDQLQGLRQGKDVQTGLYDIDAWTGGMDNGELIVLAARPSEGKTALLERIAENVGQTKNALLFSLEMPGHAIVKRTLFGNAQVSMHYCNTGRLTRSEFNEVSNASNSVSLLNIWLDETPNLTGHQIYTRAQRMAMELGSIGMVGIDYLQLMAGEGREYERVTENSKIIKSLARTLNCPTVLLSQLSRKNEEENREPELSDLRSSGAIEQDADQVWFLYREGEIKKDEIGPRTLHIAKCRNGRVGKVQLQFTPGYTRFESFSNADEPNF